MVRPMLSFHNIYVLPASRHLYLSFVGYQVYSLCLVQRLIKIKPFAQLAQLDLEQDTRDD